MAEQIGFLYVNMGLESASFVAGLKRAGDVATQTGQRINTAMNFAKGGIIGLAGALSVDMFLGVVKGAFDFSDAIVDLADKTGASTKFIQEFGYAAQMSGSSVESARAGLEKFTKLLGEAQSGGKSQLDTLKALGVTSFETDTAVRQAADGISKLDSVQKQNASTMDLFGKKAGDLTVLMSGGSKAINELAGRANEFGIVMEDSVLRNAGKVNDQLDTMKMILDAQMANMIVQNADALNNLATAFMTAAGAAANFFASLSNGGNMDILNNPALTNTMSRLMGNDPNATRKNARAGLMSNRDGRALLKQKNTADLNSLDGKGGNLLDIADNPQARANERRRLLLERKEILAAEKAANAPPKPRAIDHRSLANVHAAGGKPKSGKSAEDLAKEAAEREAAYQQELSRARQDYLGTQQDLATNAIDRNIFEREMLANEMRARNADLDANGPQGSKKLTQAQVDELKSLNEKISYNRADLINRRENQFLADEELKLASAGLSTQSDLLGLEANSARTLRERRDVELRILGLKFQQEKLVLDAVLANKESTDAERKIAQARLDALPKLLAGETQAINQRNVGPLASYLDAIPRTADEINEQLESVSVKGLDSLQSGLINCIDGTGDLADAFGDMAHSIVNGLIQIALQQAVIKPLGSLLFGGGDSGGSGLLGGLLAGVTKGVSGGKANGGMGNSGRWLVGEHGPEVVDMDGPFNVIPNSKLKNARGGSGGGLNVTFGSITSNDPAAVKAMAYQAIAEIQPMLMKQSSDFTMGRLRRPGL